MAKKRGLLVANPKSRMVEERVPGLIDQLRLADVAIVKQVNVHRETLRGLVEGLANEIDLVIAAGGDGTLNSVVQAMVGTELPLGVLPLGTANVFARTLGTTLPRAGDIIAAGRTRLTDLGWVNGVYFFNVASLGLTVEITRRMTKAAKQRWGVLAYGVVAAHALSQQRPFRVSIKNGGRIDPNQQHSDQRRQWPLLRRRDQAHWRICAG